MSVPSQVATRRVVFTYIDPAGEPVVGYILFTPTVGTLVVEADTIMAVAPIKVTLDEDGYGEVVLACTDDTDVTPTGWAWAVSEFIPNGRRGDNAYFVQVPLTATDGIGLTDLPGAVPTAFGVPGVGGSGGGTGDLTKVEADTYYEPIGTTAAQLGGHTGAADPHPQYETSAEAAAKITAHLAVVDPHPQYETSAEAAAKDAAHVAAADPHPQYLTQAEGDARYATVAGSGITKDQADTYYDAIGTADASMATHLGSADPHPQYETATEAAAKITAHVSASDPHGDRAYADAQVATRAASSHSHTTGDITSLAEFIRDTLGATLVAGAGVTVAVDDAADTVTISGSTIDAEQVQDIVGAMIVAGANIGVTYNDTAGTFTIAVAGVELAGAAAAAVGAHEAASNPHPQYATDSDLTTGLAGKESAGTAAAAVAAHHGASSTDHDDRYYTESEVDTLLSAKAAASDLSAHLADTADAHDASAISVDAAGFNGNLSTGDDTVQKVAQKLDDLVLSSKPADAVWVYLAEPGSPTEPYLYLHDNGDGTFTWRRETGIPGAPTGIAAVRGDTQATVSWTAPTAVGLGAMTYSLEQSTNGGSTWSSVATGLTGTSRVVTGLTNGTAIRFRVRAVTSWGSSAWNTMSADVTPAGVPATPSAPGVTAGDAQVALAWSAPSSNGAAITGYLIQRKLGAGGTYADLTTVGAVTSHTDSTVSNGSTYYYRIRAINAVGNSAFSADSSAASPVAPAGGTFEFFPSSNSGSLSGTDVGWPVGAIGAGGGAGTSGVAVPLGVFFDGDAYNNYMALIEFDTSSLVDGATVTGATLELSGGTVDFADIATTIEVYAYDYGSGIAGGDYRTRAQVQALTKLATLSLPNAAAWPNASTRVTLTNVGSALAAAINKTGPTRLLVVSSLHSTNASSGDAATGSLVNINPFGGTAPHRLTVVTS